MKLKDTFITHMSNGEQILVDASGKFSGIIRNNESAAFIVECLKKETTVEIEAAYNPIFFISAIFIPAFKNAPSVEDIPTCFVFFNAI